MQTQVYEEIQFQGLPICPGVVVGKVCLFNEQRHSNLPVYRVVGEGKVREHNRLEQAISLVHGRLDELIHQVTHRVGTAEAEIFKVQKMLLGDRTMRQEMTAIIETSDVNAEVAVTRVFDNYETRIGEVDNDYVKERATDIGEIRRRILDVMRDMNPSLQCNNEETCQRGKGRIIVATELTPSLTVEIGAQRPLGFVTERGGVTSHAAILARALGIPAVSGVEKIHSRISCGTELLINGDTGQVVIWPEQQTVSRHRISSRISRNTEVPDPIPNLRIMANISSSLQTEEVIANKAEGIGMYRTEFELISADRMLDEDEQFERYASVVKAMNGQTVVFRLFDLGGDKKAPFLGLPSEGNPYLGLRGSRLLLSRPDILRPQARALARAAALGPVSVLYPMIVERQQFIALKQLFLSSISDLDASGVKHGVMFEVPSACLEAEPLLDAADFGSIGTNDLVQYLFAVDRNNGLVARDYTPDKPIFWAMIRGLARAARDTDKPLSVCGEAAANPDFLHKFIEAGIETVSVSSRLIPQLRRTAQNIQPSGIQHDGANSHDDK